MVKKLSWLFIFGVIAFGSLTTMTNAQSRVNEDSIDLEMITCRELLKSEGANRANLIIFMHGYISGKKNDSKIDVEALSVATDKVTDSCIDSPDTKLLRVFQRSRR